MSIHECVCQNPECQTKYTVSAGEKDDGYCSFECWELANCKDPQDTGDILDVRIEEIIESK